eukprot:gene11555-4806_t
MIKQCPIDEEQEDQWNILEEANSMGNEKVKTFYLKHRLKQQQNVTKIVECPLCSYRIQSHEIITEHLEKCLHLSRDCGAFPNPNSAGERNFTSKVNEATKRKSGPTTSASTILSNPDVLDLTLSTEEEESNLAKRKKEQNSEDNEQIFKKQKVSDVDELEMDEDSEDSSSDIDINEYINNIHDFKEDIVEVFEQLKKKNVKKLLFSNSEKLLLKLDSNNIEETENDLFEFIKTSKSLEELKLSMTFFDDKKIDSCCQAISQSSTLKKISFSFDFFRCHFFAFKKHLASHPSLEELELVSMRDLIEDHDIHNILELSSLKKLTLCFCDFDSPNWLELIKKLKEKENIIEMTFNDSNIDSIELDGLKNLKSLSFKYCHKEFDSFPKFLKSNSKLENFKLIPRKKMYSKIPKEVFLSLPSQLKSIEIFVSKKLDFEILMYTKIENMRLVTTKKELKFINTEKLLKNIYIKCLELEFYYKSEDDCTNLFLTIEKHPSINKFVIDYPRFLENEENMANYIKMIKGNKNLTSIGLHNWKGTNMKKKSTNSLLQAFNESNIRELSIEEPSYGGGTFKKLFTILMKNTTVEILNIPYCRRKEWKECWEYVEKNQKIKQINFGDIHPSTRLDSSESKRYLCLIQEKLRKNE